MASQPREPNHIRAALAWHKSKTNGSINCGGPIFPISVLWPVCFTPLSADLFFSSPSSSFPCHCFVHLLFYQLSAIFQFHFHCVCLSVSLSISSSLCREIWFRNLIGTAHMQTHSHLNQLNRSQIQIHRELSKALIWLDGRHQSASVCDWLHSAVCSSHESPATVCRTLR